MIHIDPKVCDGRPHIAGTQLSVATVRWLLDHGETIDDLLMTIPGLNRRAIEMAYRFARDNP